MGLLRAPQEYPSLPGPGSLASWSHVLDHLPCWSLFPQQWKEGKTGIVMTHQPGQRGRLTGWEGLGLALVSE